MLQFHLNLFLYRICICRRGWWPVWTVDFWLSLQSLSSASLSLWENFLSFYPLLRLEMSLWEQLLSFPHFEVRIVPVRTPSNSLSKAKTFTISSFPFKANLCTIIRNLASQYFLFWVTSLLFVKYEWCHVHFKNNTVSFIQAYLTFSYITDLDL